MWRILMVACFVCSLFNNYEAFGNASSEQKINFTYLVFPVLNNYHFGATNVTEDKYPWIAQVVHSTKFLYPHMCTAVCIAEAIFISAARCFYTLKISYTNIIYDKNRFIIRAFVFPTKPTPQMYDDIGFIVVEKGSYNGKWPTVALTDVKRTDEAFNWFDKMDRTGPWKVVGYAGEHLPDGKSIVPLTELPVVVGLDLCANIYTDSTEKVKRYRVPCYHNCTWEQFNEFKPACEYHGTAGAAVYHETKNILLGLATWGADYGYYYALPVGISVVNSADFFDEYECAKKIKSWKPLGVKDNYQRLCK